MRVLRTIVLALLAAGLTAGVAAAARAGADGAGAGDQALVRPLELRVAEPVVKAARKPPRQPRASSRAVGRPSDGRLVDGVQLPPEGRDFLTWDPILERLPNRGWRVWGTDRLVRVLETALRDYRARNPDAPRALIGDLSRPRGGDFGPQYGKLGHASHQNGLDVDIYYPRKDRKPTGATKPSQVDRRLSQELIDAFLRRPSTQFLFVGLNVGLTGPPGVVQAIQHHDDHVHVRILPRR